MTTTTTTTTPTRLTRSEYLIQLQAQLADLGAEKWGYNSLNVNDVRVNLEAPDSGGDWVKAVTMRTSYGRHGRGKHRFTKTDDVQHVASQVRRVLAEHAQTEQASKLYWEKAEARAAREQAALAPLKAAATVATSGASARVYGMTVDETTVDGQPTYRFGFEVSGLTETQVLAMLAAVGK